MGLSHAAVHSMGGLCVQPDLVLDQRDLANAAMLSVPGGHLWPPGQGESAVVAIRQLHAAGAVVAGIDSGVLAVSDGGVISASHPGSVAFAREVIHTLNLYNASDRDHWYRLLKHAQLPPWCMGEALPA